jgi:hypothetical protein
MESVRSASICPDLGQPLPDGATLTVLACEEGWRVDEAIERFTGSTQVLGSWWLTLDRVQLAPGESIAPDQPFQPLAYDLLYVESGTLVVFKTSSGHEESYAEGEQVFIDRSVAPGDGQFSDNVVYGIRSEGPAPLSLLRFRWTGAAGGASSPVIEYPQTGSSSPDHLLTMGLKGRDLPQGPAIAFIARLTLEPGMDLGTLTYAGPVAQAVESGTLTLEQDSAAPVVEEEPPEIWDVIPAGQTASLSADQFVLLPMNTPHRVQNTTGETLGLLIVGIIPSEEMAAVGNEQT